MTDDAPQFVLGFKELHDEIPDIVGDPKENEHFNSENDDSLQLTANGLLVWRKRDNLTAFTNGNQTWVRGPDGAIYQRPNAGPLFTWEAPLVPSPILHLWQSPNCWPGRPYGDPFAIVLHTEAGYEAGAVATFMNRSAQVSAHFGVSLAGDVDQLVELSDSAWHAGILEEGNLWGMVYGGPWDGDQENPNWHTVGIETEDRGDPTQIVTGEQFSAVVAVVKEVISRYPSIRYLLRHQDISPHSRPNCPGPRWVQSGKLAALAEATGLKLLR